MPSLSCTSGDTVPMRLLITGRRRSPAGPPATAVAISTAWRARPSPCTMPMRCLLVLFQPASISCSWAVSPQSPALTVGHQNEIEPRQSCMRVTASRSALVDLRRSPVRQSTTSTPQPSVVP